MATAGKGFREMVEEILSDAMALQKELLEEIGSLEQKIYKQQDIYLAKKIGVF